MVFSYTRVQQSNWFWPHTDFLDFHTRELNSPIDSGHIPTSSIFIHESSTVQLTLVTYRLPRSSYTRAQQPNWLWSHTDFLDLHTRELNSPIDSGHIPTSSIFLHESSTVQLILATYRLPRFSYTRAQQSNWFWQHTDFLDFHTRELNSPIDSGHIPTSSIFIHESSTVQLILATYRLPRFSYTRAQQSNWFWPHTDFLDFHTRELNSPIDSGHIPTSSIFIHESSTVQLTLVTYRLPRSSYTRAQQPIDSGHVPTSSIFIHESSTAQLILVTYRLPRSSYTRAQQSNWFWSHTDFPDLQFQLVEVVNDSLVLGVQAPIMSQPPQKFRFRVVGPFHERFRKVHDPTLQKVVIRL